MARLIAITGATGFVGNHLAPHLLRQGHALRLLVRDPQRLAARFDTAPVEIVSGSLADPSSLHRLCDGADVLIHCAGLISARSEAAFAAVNVEGTKRLVETAALAGVPRLVHLSSLAAREPGLSPYAATKREGDEAVAATCPAAMSWIVLRPPAVYGPGDRATLPLIEQLSRRWSLIPGRPDARIALIHVRDLVSALAYAAVDGGLDRVICELDDGKLDGYGWQELKSAACNGASGKCIFIPRQVIEVAARMSEAWAHLGAKLPMLTRTKVAELYHPDWVCRNNLLASLSDWRPDVPFRQGFAETLKWYRQAGWLS